MEQTQIGGFMELGTVVRFNPTGQMMTVVEERESGEIRCEWEDAGRQSRWFPLESITVMVKVRKSDGTVEWVKESEVMTQKNIDEIRGLIPEHESEIIDFIQPMPDVQPDQPDLQLLPEDILNVQPVVNDDKNAV